MTHQPLAPYALFAGMLAMAGLPIYIHAPKFYVDEFGVSLAMLGTVLFGLRLLDVVQDPALGWLSQRLSKYRGISVGLATAVMALAMIGLFAVQPPVSPVVWFALTLACLFSAFSFLTITFYSEGVATARRMTGDGHVRLAGWRETGALIGVSIASVLPVVILGLTDSPFTFFAGIFALCAVIAAFAMRSEWRGAYGASETSFRTVLADPQARRLLMIALLNATPVAVSSTLFLFFVESRLEAPGFEGPLLLLFFVAAAIAAPFWSKVAQRYGAKPTLMLGMSLAIVSFAWAAALGPGDTFAFTIICILSGATLGADMTLLPALFAQRMAKIAPNAAEGFGLWSFVSKFSLAFAAIVLLPLLDAAGFQAGQSNQPEQALYALTLSYAVLPCGLKLVALMLLAATPMTEARGTAPARGTQ